MTDQAVTDREGEAVPVAVDPAPRMLRREIVPAAKRLLPPRLRASEKNVHVDAVMRIAVSQVAVNAADAVSVLPVKTKCRELPARRSRNPFLNPTRVDSRTICSIAWSPRNPLASRVRVAKKSPATRTMILIHRHQSRSLWTTSSRAKWEKRRAAVLAVVAHVAAAAGVEEPRKTCPLRMHLPSRHKRTSTTLRSMMMTMVSDRD